MNTRKEWVLLSKGKRLALEVSGIILVFGSSSYVLFFNRVSPLIDELALFLLFLSFFYAIFMVKDFFKKK